MKVYYSGYSDKCFHVLLQNISQYLEKHRSAKILDAKENNIVYDGINYNILDCEMLIYMPEEERYIGISFSDYQSELSNFFLHRNHKNDIFFCSQYTNTIFYNNSISHNFKVKKFIYLPSNPNICLDKYYIQRSLKTEYVDKFVFRGNVTEGSRNAAILLKNSEYFKGYDYLIPNEYFEDLIDYKVGLCLPGTGELCYRDIEYMALGVPMMKVEYLTQLTPRLIPNYHYISIDREIEDSHYDYNGGLIAIERELGSLFYGKYIERFLEVKEDYYFLNYISNNARKYYEDYLHPMKRLKHAINILEL